MFPVKKKIDTFFRFQKHMISFFTVILFLLSGQVAYSETQTVKTLSLVNLRVVSDDARLRVIAVFDREPNYAIQLLKAPTRLVINLPAVDFSAQKQGPAIMGMLTDIRYGLSGFDKSRIIITTKTPFTVEKDKIQQLDSGLWQLVIDVVTDNRQNFEKALKKQQDSDSIATNVISKSPVKPFRIVIDAGHGGIDSGAEGISGIKEKDVTLAFARALQEQLEKNPKLDVFLTRDSDTFLRLNERVQKARTYGTDLFISIHADTINNNTMRGATIYTISDQASDDLARALAERENKADLLDGLPADETPEVADILIDLARRETLAFSIKFADSLVSTLSHNKINLIKNPHRYAGFQVLKAPDIPSVLIEIGYLSNKEDEQLISDPLWRAKTAEAIADAVQQFAAYRRGQSGL